MNKILGICTDTAREDGEVLLDENGKKMNGAIGWYRIINPLSKMNQQWIIDHRISNTPQNALEMKEKGDIWFSKMSDNDDVDIIYMAHKEFTGCKFVLDLDDDPISIEKKHPDYNKIKEKEPMRIRVTKMADHVVCSTQEIADSIKQLNAKTTVIPNAIDPKIWEVKRPKKRTDGKIRIGWISSASHFADLPIINPVMEEILEKYPQVEFYYTGMVKDDSHDGNVHHLRGTSGYKNFPQWYADQDFDIAVAPLKDSKFNRCKSNIKWMEAAMLEIPVVASDVSPYKCIKHGFTGFLAKDKQQFIKYLEILIESEEKRKEIGQNSKKDVLENWTIDKFIPKYKELFEKIGEKKDITVMTAISGNKDDLKDQPEYKGVRYVAFTEKPKPNPLWETYPVCEKFKKPVMNAKVHKILSHKYTDTPYILWIDGSITLKNDPHELIKTLEDKDIAVFKHPGRNCIYTESDACVALKKGDPAEIAEQVKEYAKKDYPADNGLYELTAFFRKNNDKVNTLFEKWWSDITRYSNRDQISFPAIFDKKELSIIPGSVEDSKEYPNTDPEIAKLFPGNDYFKITRHKK